MRPTALERRRFRHIALAGIFFEGGGAAIDTRTIVAALVHGLSGGSPLAVGAANAIARCGWLVPQIFVGYLAQGRRRRMPFYMVGAYGRVACLVGVGAVLLAAGALPSGTVLVAFFVIWTVYAFVGGVVAVPYNDIVARAVASHRRSRLLAVRLFGGGLLALGVAAAADRLLASVPDFEAAYAAIILLGAGLFAVSATSFVSALEPPAPDPEPQAGFAAYLRRGREVLAGDPAFHRFVVSRWLGGLVTMAQPFYIVQVAETRGATADVAMLLAAQTAGALASNPLWGWWGDRQGKLNLLKLVAALGAAAPALTLVWAGAGAPAMAALLTWFVPVFFLLGAVGNGDTIAHLGYLMEISPERERPAYSGYFNLLAAPAALLPLAGAGLVEAVHLHAVFVAAVAAAALQYLALRRLGELGFARAKS